jgi:hypothetical protein
VGPVVLALVFLATLLLGAAVARAILALVLAVVTGREGLSTHALRVGVFVGALIVFWSLVPARAESPGTSTAITIAR